MNNTWSKLTLIVLISIALIITAYTISVYEIASHVYESDGLLWWPNTLGGSFYPWPHIPAGISGQMLTELDQEDYLYYNYVVESWVLMALTVLLWIVVFWRVWRIRGINRSH
jgi:hypothetical protein